MPAFLFWWRWPRGDGLSAQQYLSNSTEGNSIERTLVFYREDGVNTNTGAPITSPLKRVNLRRSRRCSGAWPDQAMASVTLSGEFTNELPDDVGGAGAYTNLTPAWERRVFTWSGSAAMTIWPA